MSGVSWDERKEGDWLASNGKWYRAVQRPRGWGKSSLPPAPGHVLRGNDVIISDRTHVEPSRSATPARHTIAEPDDEPGPQRGQRRLARVGDPSYRPSPPSPRPSLSELPPPRPASPPPPSGDVDTDEGQVSYGFGKLVSSTRNRIVESLNEAGRIER